MLTLELEVPSVIDTDSAVVMLALESAPDVVGSSATVDKVEMGVTTTVSVLAPVDNELASSSRVVEIVDGIDVRADVPDCPLSVEVTSAVLLKDESPKFVLTVGVTVVTTSVRVVVADVNVRKDELLAP